MAVDHIRYDIRAQDALRALLRDVLAEVARKGLPGEHHFYIAFGTRADGVRLSARLREQYPEEMTIVLQHQFWDLRVTDDGFEVGLSFGGVPERLGVPFAAVRSFVDPSVQFALQFEQLLEKPAGAAAPRTREKPAPKSSDKPRDKAPAEKAAGDKTAAEKTKARRPAANPPRSVPGIPPAPPAAPAKSAPALKAVENDKPDKPAGGAEVVRLDRFRKK